MMKFIAITTLIFVLSHVPSFANCYHHFVPYGQSNSNGYNNDSYEYSAPRNGDLIFQISAHTISKKNALSDPLWNINHTPNSAGHGLNFARLYADSNRLDPGCKVMIIPAGVNGASISNLESGTENYDRMIAMVEKGFDRPGTHKVKAVLFQHMEADIHKFDAAGSPTPIEYTEKLARMFRKMRRAFSGGLGNSICIMVGEPARNWDHAVAARSAFVSAVKSLIEEIPNAVWVHSRNLEANFEGDIHFTASAQMKLADRYWQKYRNKCD